MLNSLKIFFIFLNLAIITQLFVIKTSFALYVNEHPYQTDISELEILAIKPITSGIRAGTGVHIGKGYVLWAHHIYKGYNPKIFFFNDFTSDVLFCDEKLDFCLGKIQDPKNNPNEWIPISTEEIVIGQLGHLTGYPGDRKVSGPVKSECLILKKDLIPVKNTLIQSYTTDCSAAHGSSNSPFINAQGIMTLYQNVTTTTLSGKQVTRNLSDIKNNLDQYATNGVPANLIAQTLLSSKYSDKFCTSSKKDYIYACQD